MQRLISRLREQGERGASAIIVALTLLVLVGFTGFGVDVTSAYAKSQEIQNAADAAALGTAQHCAQSDVTCTDGSEAGRATGLARENVRLQTATVTAQDSYPEANRVTVDVTGQHQNYFAGVLGFDSFTVNREASAEWLTITSGPATLPLTVSACSFFNLAGEPAIDQVVYLWLSKGNDTFEENTCGEGYPPGGFGWLPADADCQTEVETPGYIVVSDPGANRPSCVNLALLELGKVFLIPIFDDFETVGTGNNGRYTLLRFAAVRLEAYRFQEGGPNIENPPSPPQACPSSTRPSPSSDYRNSCLRVRFVEWVELGDEYEGDEGGSPGITLIRLVEP